MKQSRIEDIQVESTNFNTSFLSSQPVLTTCESNAIVSTAQMTLMITDYFTYWWYTTMNIQKRINEKFDKLYDKDDSGLYKPHVCAVCDQFVSAKKLKVATIDLFGRNEVYLKWQMISSSET